MVADRSREGGRTPRRQSGRTGDTRARIPTCESTERGNNDHALGMPPGSSWHDGVMPTAEDRPLDADTGAHRRPAPRRRNATAPFPRPRGSKRPTSFWRSAAISGTSSSRTSGGSVRGCCGAPARRRRTTPATWRSRPMTRPAVQLPPALRRATAKASDPTESCTTGSARGRRHCATPPRSDALSGITRAYRATDGAPSWARQEPGRRARLAHPGRAWRRRTRTRALRPRRRRRPAANGSTTKPSRRRRRRRRRRRSKKKTQEEEVQELAGPETSRAAQRFCFGYD